MADGPDLRMLRAQPPHLSWNLIVNIGKAWLHFCLLCMALPGNASAASVLLKPEQVWTAGEATHRNWVVLVTDNRIAYAGPESGAQLPEGTQRIELPGATLLPGLMDL